MPETRKTVMRLKFNAERYKELGLDAAALAEVLSMQEILTEAGKIVWRKANPGRKNLPPYYGAELELWMQPLERGSTIAPLQARRRQGLQRANWDDEVEYLELGAQQLSDGYSAVAQDMPLPNDYPKDLVAVAARFGEHLLDDDEVEIEACDRAPVKFTSTVRRKFSELQETPHGNVVEVVGHVLMADVKNHRFQLWPTNGKGIPIDFPAEQEALVIEALREHETRMLRVRGEARILPSGQVERFVRVDHIGAADEEFDEGAPDIADTLAAIWAKVPDKELNKIPRDAARNLDHYLYGAPKRRG